MDAKLGPSPSDYEWNIEKGLGKIPPTLGQGIEWTHEREGHLMRTELSDYHFKNGKRKAQLLIHSWIGSIGAMHYYAKITVESATVVNVTEGTRGHGGYVGVPKDSPLQEHIKRELSLCAQRRLSKVEKDMNGEVLGKIGDMTDRFNTPTEAREAAIRMFKKRFAPGWVLVADKMGDNDEDYPTIAET